jgi:hypothetical protein
MPIGVTVQSERHGLEHGKGACCLPLSLAKATEAAETDSAASGAANPHTEKRREGLADLAVGLITVGEYNYDILERSTV